MYKRLLNFLKEHTYKKGVQRNSVVKILNPSKMVKSESLVYILREVNINSQWFFLASNFWFKNSFSSCLFSYPFHCCSRFRNYRENMNVSTSDIWNTRKKQRERRTNQFWKFKTIWLKFRGWQKKLRWDEYHKILNSHPKIWTGRLYHWIMRPNEVNRIVNSVDLDQTTPQPVWSRSTLFAQTYLSEDLIITKKRDYCKIMLLLACCC